MKLEGFCDNVIADPEPHVLCIVLYLRGINTFVPFLSLFFFFFSFKEKGPSWLRWHSSSLLNQQRRKHVSPLLADNRGSVLELLWVSSQAEICRT